MPTMTVESAAPEVIGVTDVWRVITRYPSGDGVTHIFPTATLDWRAAEYGIDPSDVDTLLEVVLHEPHLPVTVDNTGATRYDDNGPDLWTAENTDAAREAHLARVKTCPVRIGVRGVAALDSIRTGYVPDLDRIRTMRETVDTNRWLKKYGDLPARPADPIEARMPGIPTTSGPRGRN